MHVSVYISIYLQKHTEIHTYVYTYLGEGNGNPLQSSCLENPMDRGAWWATVQGVTKSQTWLKRLSTYIYTNIYIYGCTYIYTNIYIYGCTHIYTNIYIYMGIYTYTQYIHIYGCTHIYTNIYIYMGIHTYTLIYICVCVCVCESDSRSVVSDSLQPMDCSLPGSSLSMEFSRQEY